MRFRGASTAANLSAIPPDRKVWRLAPVSLQVEQKIDEPFHKTHIRHVFRSITRELSYFPDRFAAEWIRQHILHRFRGYKQKIHDSGPITAYEDRLKYARRKARQVASQLQKANEGDRKMMVKALNMAYGRVGARRRVLLQPLLPKPQAAEDSAKPLIGALESSPVSARDAVALNEDGAEERDPDPEFVSGAVEEPQNVVEIKPKPPQATVKEQTRAFIDSLPPPLHALVTSQIASSPPEGTRRNPKRLSISIPELNAWNRPMPQSRVKNQIQAWYAKTLDCLLPPLPDAEWHRLHGLASGKGKLEGVKPRRKKLEVEITALEMVVLKGRVPEGFMEKRWTRKITPRFMRSVWGEVFGQCSRLDYNGTTGKWSVVWGHHVLAARPAAAAEKVSGDAAKREETSSTESVTPTQ